VKNVIAALAYLISFCHSRQGLNNGLGIYIYNADGNILESCRTAICIPRISLLFYIRYRKPGIFQI